MLIEGGDGADTINFRSGSVFGGSGNDLISMSYGHGSALINGGTGNDTIYGVSSSTIGVYYQYEAGDGNDVLYGFTAYDTLIVSGGTYSTQESGNDFIVKIGSNTITLKDAASISANIYGEYSDDDSDSGGVLTLGTDFTDSTIYLKDYDATNVDATTLSRRIKILYGGVGNDRLLGNNGDDTLYGGAGTNTLTGGNDVITDYRAGYDKIKLASGSITRSSLSGANVILTVGSGKITVKGSKGKKISVIDTSGRETSQKYTSAVYGSSALLADDNFMMNDARLDAITENKFAITSIETPATENFVQETLVTYSGD